MAVLTIPALKAKIIAFLYDNITHDITGQDAQDICTDIVDSLLVGGSGGAASIVPWNSGTTYVGGSVQYVSRLNNIYKLIKVTNSTNEAPESNPLVWELSSAGAAVMFSLLTGYNGLADVAVAPLDDSMTLIRALWQLEQHINAAVLGLWNDRGNFDASGGAYPSTGGSGTAGAILKGDTYLISVAGTLPTGQVVEVGDTVRALVDTPGNTQANWAIMQYNIQYVPENVANKDTDNTLSADSDTKYASQKAVKAYIDGRTIKTFFAEIAGTPGTEAIGTVEHNTLGANITLANTGTGTYAFTADQPIFSLKNFEIDLPHKYLGDSNVGEAMYEWSYVNTTTIALSTYLSSAASNVPLLYTNLPRVKIEVYS